MSSSLSEPLTGDSRLPPHDVRGGSDPRGGDLVSRLLAATPPYLYSFAPPNSFFFSEMLRSFVHAKQPLDNAANPPVCGPPSNPVTSAPGLAHHRRPRKRSWRDQGPVKMPLGLLQSHSGLAPMSSLPPAVPIASDKPLELTTHRSSMNQPPHQTQPLPPPPTTSSDEKRSTTPPSAPHPNPLVNLLPPCNPLPDPQLPSDLLLPPTQPLWYPPLYPLPGGPQQPYGFDPLHFFIDLRVSGHIFDRNKNGKDESDEVKVKQSKHCSAFSVPQPRNHDSQNGGGSQEEHPRPAPNSTHYVMQNLSRIYDDVRTLYNRPSPKRSPSPPPQKCAEDSNNNSRSSDDEDSKPVIVDCEKTEETSTVETKEEDMTEEEREAKRAKDLRALIGLELVVDYVNHSEDGSPKKRSISPLEEDDTPADVDGSESLERSASSPASVCSRSRSRTPSPPPRVPSPVPPPPYMNHGPAMYHDFHHLPSVFLRERSDAINLQVRHH